MCKSNEYQVRSDRGLGYWLRHQVCFRSVINVSGDHEFFDSLFQRILKWGYVQRGMPTDVKEATPLHPDWLQGSYWSLFLHEWDGESIDDLVIINRQDEMVGHLIFDQEQRNLARRYRFPYVCHEPKPVADHSHWLLRWRMGWCIERESKKLQVMGEPVTDSVFHNNQQPTGTKIQRHAPTPPKKRGNPESDLRSSHSDAMHPQNESSHYKFRWVDSPLLYKATHVEHWRYKYHQIIKSTLVDIYGTIHPCQSMFHGLSIYHWLTGME